METVLEGNLLILYFVTLLLVLGLFGSHKIGQVALRAVVVVIVLVLSNALMVTMATYWLILLALLLNLLPLRIVILLHALSSGTLVNGVPAVKSANMVLKLVL